jgi:ADP-ribose pyrophosphatase
VFEGPAAAVIVPVFEDGTTVLVRQWRHAWDSSSWEAPAGTLAEGEAPDACARRELIEETGLSAGRLTPLGIARGSAISTVVFHLFLAQGLERMARSPEPSEADMILRELPLSSAVDAALGGGIVHAGSITAICRAARILGVV